VGKHNFSVLPPSTEELREVSISYLYEKFYGKESLNA